MNSLSPAQQDALMELGNIGAGHAASSLASLLQRPISLTAPNIGIPPVSSLISQGIDKLIVAVEMGILGDVTGHILVVFDRAEAVELAVDFVRRMVKIENPSNDDVDSTLQEFANIIGGSYLAALSQLTGLQLALSTPTVATGTIQAVFAELPSLENDPEVLLIDSQFVSGEHCVPGQIVLIPHETSITSLLAPLGAKAGIAL